MRVSSLGEGGHFAANAAYLQQKVSCAKPGRMPEPHTRWLRTLITVT
jgi:hypothetical protein